MACKKIHKWSVKFLKMDKLSNEGMFSHRGFLKQLLNIFRTDWWDERSHQVSAWKWVLSKTWYIQYHRVSWKEGHFMCLESYFYTWYKLGVKDLFHVFSSIVLICMLQISCYRFCIYPFVVILFHLPLLFYVGRLWQHTLGRDIECESSHYINS